MKQEIKPSPFLYPIPIVVIGVKDEEKVNFTTIGDIAMMGLTPPLITISLHERHFCTMAVRKNKQFSVNLPTKQMLKEVDTCGMVSGWDHDKSTLFEWDLSPEYPFAPVIKDVPVQLICNVIDEIQVEKRCLFVCKVLHTWVEAELIGKPLNDWSAVGYGLDNHYYTIGSKIGTGYLEGKK